MAVIELAFYKNIKKSQYKQSKTHFFDMPQAVFLKMGCFLREKQFFDAYRCCLKEKTYLCRNVSDD